MADFKPFIKQEPLDDDMTNQYGGTPSSSPMFMPEDDEEMFVAPESVMRRATDDEGRPFPTQCFQQPHLDHPHHHRLICGHDIVTDEIEKCGANCAMAKDKKAAGRAFQCPHPDCKKFDGHFIPKARAPKPRACTLSHVYGRDAKADQDRVQEKKMLNDAKNSRISTRSGQVLLPQALRRVPKRSPSPVPRAKTVADKEPNMGKKRVDVDVGKALNLEFENDPGRESVMRMTGGRERSNGMFKTDKQIAGEADMALLTRDMRGSRVASRQEQRESTMKAWEKTAEKKRSSDRFGEALNEADTEPEMAIEGCASCSKLLIDKRYHCFDCLDYDLCVECFTKNNHGHAAHHRFKGLAKPYGDWRQGPNMLQETFCECRTTSTWFLVLCVDCETPFHPGCIGAGAYEKDEYAISYLSRGACMKHDHLNWKGGKVFRCMPCQKAFELTKTTTRDTRMIERAKKRQEMAQTPPTLRKPKPKAKRAADDMEVDLRAEVDKEIAFGSKRFRVDLPIRSAQTMPIRSARAKSTNT